MKTFIKTVYSLFVVALIVATFFEWQFGTPSTTKYFYSSVWFVLLLTILVCIALYFVFKNLKNNPVALVAHIALAIIALGALVTHISSTKGQLHLRVGEPQNQFLDSDGKLQNLQQSITLKNFEITNYPGTDTPMDFVSKISFSDNDSATVSMNNVVSINGYRLYQSSFDMDHHGSIFMVNYDPFGIPITYFGYFLLFVSLIGVLINPKGNFRKIVKNISAASLLLLCFSSCNSDDNSLPPHPSKDQAREFSKVCVFYNDRIVPLNTYATDFCLKVTGKPSYKGLSPEQFLLGWMLYPEKWQYENDIYVKNSLPDTCNVKLDGKYTSVAELYGSDGNYKLICPDNVKIPKSIEEVSEKLQLIISLTNCSALKIFPFNVDNKITWLSSVDKVPDSTSDGQLRMIHEWSEMTRIAFDNNDSEMWNLIPLQLARYQLATCKETLPSPTIRRIEIAYNRIRPTTWLYRFQLVFALLLLALSIVKTIKDSDIQLAKIQLVVISVFFVLQLFSLIIRGVISQSIPISNGYETMLFLALSILGIAFFVGRIQLILSSMCLLLSGFALLVADIAISNPYITPLMPVLHSPWLSIHVMSVMISYSLFTVVTLNAIVSQSLTKKTDTEKLEKFNNITYVLLYPAVVLLSIGIFIGAIWANESWGNYWSWDPKEVWALITLLVYVVPLHQSFVPKLKNPRTLNIYLIFAFITVLMTYFGVNYLLGGMHSYAG